MAKINKFMVTRVKAEVLEGICNSLQADLDNTMRHYTKTGRQIQDKHWDSSIKDYVLEWEDAEQTIPIMIDEWGDVEYTDEELEENPEILARREVLQMVITQLEKML